MLPTYNSFAGNITVMIKKRCLFPKILSTFKSVALHEKVNIIKVYPVGKQVNIRGFAFHLWIHHYW
jgi:hypothetical protein